MSKISLGTAYYLKRRRKALNGTEKRMDEEAIDTAPSLELDSAESEAMEPLTSPVPDPMEDVKQEETAVSRVMKRLRKSRGV